MGVELQKIQRTNEDSDRSEGRSSRPDNFYYALYEARNIGDYYFANLSYVEEKGLYFKSQQYPIEKRGAAMRRFNVHQQLLSAANPFGMSSLHHFDGNDNHNSLQQDEAMPNSASAASMGNTDLMPRFEGREVGPRMSSTGQSLRRDADSDNASQQNNTPRKEPKMVMFCHRHLLDVHHRGKATVCDETGSMFAPPISLAADFFHPASKNKDIDYSLRRFSSRFYVKSQPQRPLSRRTQRPSPSDIQDLRATSPLLKPSPLFKKVVEHGIMAELELHSFDSKSQAGVNDKTKTIYPQFPSNVSVIIKRYETMLSSLLKQRDYSAVDDCMIDFWDEFFPTTETIHFYDRHTPVPRMSKLQTFLSRPCPKAFGTIQCEIERVRVRYRTKGMLTGRYYSTYEYRLFITDRRLIDSTKPRCDTLMMTAKYRGKHYSGQSGLADPSGSGKKGVNHYFLYMPQNDDIHDHFELVNEHLDERYFNRYIQRVPDQASKELSRLQTNYLGTDFQITAPLYASDSDADGSNESHLENVEIPVQPQSPSLEEEPVPKGKLKKIFSLKKSFKKQKSNRPFAAKISPFSYLHKRRVDDFVQETPCNQKEDEIQKMCVQEKEIGAITYTANVLGNRPRMMNVSIPNVNNETEMPIASDATWIKAVGEEGRILQKLKAQQSNPDADTDLANDASSENSPDNAYGLMSLRNRQPWWNVDLGAFVLNFGGRVSVASVKNFQLCEANDQENNPESILLQFGRIEGRHSFNMDFCYPLSPVQAFAISISSLQSKISFA